jgi:hypothetical protein
MWDIERKRYKCRSERLGREQIHPTAQQIPGVVLTMVKHGFRVSWIFICDFHIVMNAVDD